MQYLHYAKKSHHNLTLSGSYCISTLIKLINLEMNQIKINSHLKKQGKDNMLARSGVILETILSRSTNYPKAVRDACLYSLAHHNIYIVRFSLAAINIYKCCT